MLILALKLFLAPACVVAISLAGRRWGATVAGLLGGLPVLGWTAFFAGIALLGWLGPPIGVSFLLAALTFALGRLLVSAHQAVAPSSSTGS